MAIQQFSESLPMRLYRALDAVMPRFRKIFSEFGLTEQQWRVLRVLWERETVALNKLSDITLIPAPSLVGVVDRLTTMGMVERQRSKTDRRIVFIVATAKGRRLEAKVMPKVRQTYDELQKSVDTATWKQLMSALDAISETNNPAP